MDRLRKAGSRAGATRWLSALAALVLAGVLFPSWSTASTVTGSAIPPMTSLDVASARAYSGPTYLPLPDGEPTEYETQNKLWFHDRAWWALMLTESGALAVHELLPDHTWRAASAPLSNAPVAVGDVLAGRSDVRVIFSEARGLAYARLDFDAARRTFVLDAVGVRSVTDRGGRTASLDVDSTDRVWIAFVTRSEVLVTSSADDGVTWVPPAPPPVSGTDLGVGEVAAVVAFDDSVGVMWSDQQRSRFSFAVHRDGDALTQWSLEIPLSGPGLTDDHISLKVARGPAGEMVLAAIKTSQDELGPEGAPLMMVLARPSTGGWVAHVAGVVADQQNRPSLVVDEVNAAVHFLSHAPASGGSIYVNSAPLSDLRFRAGRGEVLLSGDGRVADVTTPDHALTSASGLVVLASSREQQRYYHAEVPLGGSGPAQHTDDGRPPEQPADLFATPNGGDSVVLSWPAALDTGQWVPAAAGTPASSYVILRDGAPVGKATSPSYVDRPSRAGALEYSVVAVDAFGNASEPGVRVSVVLNERDGQLGMVWVTALVVLAAAAITGAWRRFLVKL